MDWTDPAALGYPAVFGGVLLGSIVPVVPTGAVVGAAAAIAVTTDQLSLPLVVVVSVLGALIGDLVTFGVAKAGSAATQRWVARGQRPERLEAGRTRFARRGALLVVVGRLLPAGRIPVLLAAGALDYPWRRLVPAAVLACVLWAVAYAVLGMVSGGLFDSPVVATLVATALVFAVAGVGALVSRLRADTGGART
ncbi:VTT domain-containing protein [Pseudonocardia sp.]|uniref:DedA family protein n=1 Tax=Pseudonocardia sp. TaxID=60912 RepID=UPI0026229933|nr:VTT domain-containing protein [Pseudonocardia sp.]